MNSSAIPIEVAVRALDGVDSRREAVRYHVQLAHELEEAGEGILPLSIPVDVLETTD